MPVLNKFFLNRHSRTENRDYTSSKAGSFDSNVDQDISHLSSRTHAEHESKAGRRRMFSQQDGETARDYMSGITTLEKAAQGGRGFQTVGLDLGVLGSRRNTDEEINKQAASSGTFESNYHKSQSSSKGAQSSSSHSYSAHDSNQQGYDDAEYEEYEEEIPTDHGVPTHASSTHHQSSHYSYNSGPRTSQSYYHSSGDAKLQHYPKKREAPHFDNPCRATNCQALRCIVGPIDKSSSTSTALIAFRTRLVAETLNKVKYLYYQLFFIFNHF